MRNKSDLSSSLKIDFLHVLNHYSDMNDFVLYWKKVLISEEIVMQNMNIAN